MDLFESEESEASEPDAPPTPPPGAGRGALHIACEDTKRTVTAGTLVEYHLIMRNDGSEPEPVTIRLDLIYPQEGEDRADWVVHVEGLTSATWDVTATGKQEESVKVDPDVPREFQILVTAPRGAAYGDQLNVLTTASSTRDHANTDSLTLSTITRQAVLAVKTTIGHERSVADSIASRSKQKKDGGALYSVLSPYALRGYVLVESMNPDRLEKIVRGIRRARGIVQGETSFDEVIPYLTPKPLVHGIVEGDIVELVAGPFKGEKARVQSIDEAKEEITVELFEAMVPIPVTIKGDSVRVIEKEGP
jgi:transcriptional antiterminator NusG